MRGVETVKLQVKFCLMRVFFFFPPFFFHLLFLSDFCGCYVGGQDDVQDAYREVGMSRSETMDAFPYTTTTSKTVKRLSRSRRLLKSQRSLTHSIVPVEFYTFFLFCLIGSVDFYRMLP